MIKTVVFDIGNVVWRYRPLHDRAFRLWGKLMGMTLPDFYSNLFEKDGLYRRFEIDSLELSDWFADIAPNIPTKKFLDILDHTFSDQTKFCHYLNRPVIKIISSLRQNHLPVGCLSNTENYFYPYLKQNILPFFDYHILSWQVKSRKPDAKIYHEIFKYGKFLPPEILFIDDVSTNVAGAKKLGINSVLFTNATQLRKDLIKFGLPISPSPKAYTS